MVLPFRPIVGQPSLADIAYTPIHDAIAQGRLRAGERLVYRTIAEEFGISPTPVRDAIQRLVSNGALALDERGVAHVPVIDADTYIEIMTLRLQLEGMAAAALATRADRDDSIIETLSATHERLVRCKQSGNVDKALFENGQFHFQFVRAAGMPVLEELIRSLWLRCGPSVRLLYQDDYIPPKSHPHVLLIDALKRGDPETARHAVEEDLKYAGRYILSQIDATAVDRVDW